MSIGVQERKTFRGVVLKASAQQVVAAVSTGFRDKQGDAIAYGAWQDVIRSGEKPLLYWAHVHDQLPLGSIDQLTELPVGDSRVPPINGELSSGLLMKATFATTTTGLDAMTLLREGHLSGQWSVCFAVAPEGEKFVRAGRDISKIAKLFEVSLVQEGAAWGTRTISASAKAALARLQSTSLTRLQEKAYALAFDRAFLQISSAELRAAREEHRREAVAAGVEVAAKSFAEQLTRAKQVQEIERRAGIEGNYFTVPPRRQPTAEELRVAEIRKLAGHI